MDNHNLQNTTDEIKRKLGHFDDEGMFKYQVNEHDQITMRKERKKQIVNLKDISENNFIELIAAKNQDKRFYHWLHMHPLFDASDWGSDNGDIEQPKDPYQNRRLSEQINLKSSLLNPGEQNKEEDK